MEGSALEIEHVTRRFGGLVALNDVSFRIRQGEMVGLIGPNGAGKSTLFGTIAGALLPDEGRISFFGRDVTRDAAYLRRRAGLCRTYQKVRLFDQLTVEQNVSVAASECAQDPRRWRHEAVAALAELQLDGLANRYPSELTLADRKRVEIARAAVGTCRLLMLDESLCGLTSDEAADMISRIRALNVQKGVTVMIVEHIMPVIMQLAQRTSSSSTTARLSPRADRPRLPTIPPLSQPILVPNMESGAQPAALLSIDGLTIAYGDLVAVNEVSFAVPAGEVFVLLGANGAGKTSILRCISGQVRPKSGTVMGEGRSLTGLRPHEVAAAGFAHVPEGRRVFANLTVEENLNVSFIQSRTRRTLTEARAAIYDLFPRLAQRRQQNAGTMSGGEQQMLAIGRGLMNFPKLLMLDEPSLGLSPIVTEQVFERLALIRESGTTLLLVEQNAIALELATQGVVLANGRSVLKGPRMALEDSDFVRRAYIGA